MKEKNGGLGATTNAARSCILYLYDRTGATHNGQALLVLLSIERAEQPGCIYYSVCIFFLRWRRQ